MSSLSDPVSPSSFDWACWPRTQTLIDGFIERAREGNALLGDLADRMIRETGTPLSVWVDHLVVSAHPA